MGYYWDLFRSMIDSSYTPEVYSKPIPQAEAVPENATPEQVEAAKEKRREQLASLSKEANEHNAGVQRAAQVTETALMSTIEFPETFVSSGTNMAWGGFTEMAVNNILEKRGEAPVRSLHSLIVPHQIPLIGGDAHYQAGGNPIDHPDRPAGGVVERGFVTPAEMVDGALVTPVTQIGQLVHMGQDYVASKFSGAPTLASSATGGVISGAAPAAAAEQPQAQGGEGFQKQAGGWMDAIAGLFSTGSIVSGILIGAITLLTGGGALMALGLGAVGAALINPITNAISGMGKQSDAPGETVTAAAAPQPQGEQPQVEVPVTPNQHSQGRGR